MVNIPPSQGRQSHSSPRSKPKRWRLTSQRNQKSYTAPPNATERQRLACATLNFFNSGAVVKDNERLPWKVKDSATIAKLGYFDNRNDIVLEFRALTSAKLVDGVYKHVVLVDGWVSDKSGMVSVDAEKLSFDVKFEWAHNIGEKLPDWSETLRLVRHGLAVAYGKDGEMISKEFEHPKLGAIKIIRHKPEEDTVREESEEEL